MAVFAVTTGRGPRWDHRKGIREQPGWDAHARWADELVARGVVIIGGPIDGDAGDDGGTGDDGDVGLVAVVAADEDEVRAVFAGDPWADSGVLRVRRVRGWSLWLDGR